MLITPHKCMSNAFQNLVKFQTCLPDLCCWNLEEFCSRTKEMYLELAATSSVVTQDDTNVSLNKKFLGNLKKSLEKVDFVGFQIKLY
jgi:hypothetical protein